MKFEHVNGTDKGELKLFALSTCVWCKRTKQLLSNMGVAYDYIFVDQLAGEVRDEAMDEVRKWNPNGSFPTLIIRGDKCIVGFKETEIREAIG